VWVTGLFDLKRGESGNKEFQRGMDEYFARFQRVIDCGACRWRKRAAACARAAVALAPQAGVPPRPSLDPLRTEFFACPPLCPLLPLARLAGFEMVIYMPLQFKSHLRLDEKKHVVIDMNGACTSTGSNWGSGEGGGGGL
jgi:hypothetical protein